MKKRYVWFAVVLALGALLVWLPKKKRVPDARRVVLCSTFPIYQLTRNVVQNVKNINVKLLLPGQLGCPHHYTLTPQDMQALAQADILVVNGLGLEEFLGAPVKSANAKLSVIDSACDIKDTIEYAGDAHHCDDECCHHAGINPHLFVSPRLSARLVKNIAEGLSRWDAPNAARYTSNAKAYGAALEHLGQSLADLGKRLKRKRVVQPHGVFDYLARDMGLEILATMQAHGQEPSANEMLSLVSIIKRKQGMAILGEPQYPEKVGLALSRETGVPFVILDPVATGPVDAPLNYYETVMRTNSQKMESVLGGR